MPAIITRSAVVQDSALASAAPGTAKPFAGSSRYSPGRRLPAGLSRQTTEELIGYRKDQVHEPGSRRTNDVRSIKLQASSNERGVPR